MMAKSTEQTYRPKVVAPPIITSSSAPIVINPEVAKAWSNAMPFTAIAPLAKVKQLIFVRAIPVGLKHYTKVYCYGPVEKSPRMVKANISNFVGKQWSVLVVNSPLRRSIRSRHDLVCLEHSRAQLSTGALVCLQYATEEPVDGETILRWYNRDTDVPYLAKSIVMIPTAVNNVLREVLLIQHIIDLQEDAAKIVVVQ